MSMDADIQVWLESQQRTQPQVIVPYVQSHNAGIIHYTVEMQRLAPQGRSQMRQSGTVHLTADQPAALGRMAVTRSPEDRCEITMTLRAPGETERRFDLACPES